VLPAAYVLIPWLIGAFAAGSFLARRPIASTALWLVGVLVVGRTAHRRRSYPAEVLIRARPLTDTYCHCDTPFTGLGTQSSGTSMLRMCGPRTLEGRHRRVAARIDPENHARISPWAIERECRQLSTSRHCCGHPCPGRHAPKATAVATPRMSRGAQRNTSGRFLGATIVCSRQGNGGFAGWAGASYMVYGSLATELER